MGLADLMSNSLGTHRMNADMGINKGDFDSAILFVSVMYASLPPTARTVELAKIPFAPTVQDDYNLKAKKFAWLLTEYCKVEEAISRYMHDTLDKGSM